jgi:hypothetical protein
MKFLTMIDVCSLRIKDPIGFSTVGVDHSYGVFEVSKIDNSGEAGNEFDTPPNTITRSSVAKRIKIELKISIYSVDKYF